jgi:hypothetical protein
MKAIALFGAHDHGKLKAWFRVVREHGGTFLPQKTALMANRGSTHHRYVRVMADIPPEHKVSFEHCVIVTGIYNGTPKQSELHLVPYIKKTAHEMWCGPHDEV